VKFVLYSRNCVALQSVRIKPSDFREAGLGVAITVWKQGWSQFCTIIGVTLFIRFHKYASSVWGEVRLYQALQLPRNECSVPLNG
jgi:hypothetical protein